MAKAKSKKKKKGPKKALSKKTVDASVWTGDGWHVVSGQLKPGKGRPAKTGRLFKLVAEKIPFEALSAVKSATAQYDIGTDGVYLAHDSMGVARYGGRGDIFGRLRSHKKKYPRELVYFSAYIIADKKHEREIETSILRAAGPQMTLNTRKIASGIEPGDVKDYEPGTIFFERQRSRGKGSKKS